MNELGVFLLLHEVEVASDLRLERRVNGCLLIVLLFTHIGDGNVLDVLGLRIGDNLVNLVRRRAQNDFVWLLPRAHALEAQMSGRRSFVPRLKRA